MHSLLFIHSVTTITAHYVPKKTKNKNAHTNNCSPEFAWCFTVWCLTPPSFISPRLLYDCIFFASLIPVSSVYRTVVKCNIAKSQALYSAQRGLKTNNAAVFKVGAIMINIPQHPATLHSMMVRSSHQLSKQISDLIRQPSNAYVCFTYSAFFFPTSK